MKICTRDNRGVSAHLVCAFLEASGGMPPGHFDNLNTLRRNLVHSSSKTKSRVSIDFH